MTERAIALVTALLETDGEEEVHAVIRQHDPSDAEDLWLHTAALLGALIQQLDDEADGAGREWLRVIALQRAAADAGEIGS